MTPSQVVLVKGIGRAHKPLVSFEMALRGAGISGYNLVQVSSILPAGVNPTSDRLLLQKIDAGTIVYCVLSRAQTNESNRLVSASIGCAIPQDKAKHGYLSEHHAFGISESEAGAEAEAIAGEMLYSLNDDRNYETLNITASSVCQSGEWLTVVSAAILI